jgi:hypothetical protein
VTPGRPTSPTGTWPSGARPGDLRLGTPRVGHWQCGHWYWHWQPEVSVAEEQDLVGLAPGSARWREHGMFGTLGPRRLRRRRPRPPAQHAAVLGPPSFAGYWPDYCQWQRPGAGAPGPFAASGPESESALAWLGGPPGRGFGCSLKPRRSAQVLTGPLAEARRGRRPGPGLRGCREAAKRHRDWPWHRQTAAAARVPGPQPSSGLAHPTRIRMGPNHWQHWQASKQHTAPLAHTGRSVTVRIGLALDDLDPRCKDGR